VPIDLVVGEAEDLVTVVTDAGMLP